MLREETITGSHSNSSYEASVCKVLTTHAVEGVSFRMRLGEF